MLPVVVAALLIGSLAAAGYTQEAAEGDKFTNVKWYQVLYHKFKPGRTAEASQIIYEHFLPVDKAVGRKVIPFDHHTGEWDHLAYFPLEQGPGELEWRPFSRPIDKKWWDALVKQEGGPDKAGALMQRFGDTLADTKWEIARRVSLPWFP
jgi:hypothetical protein